MTCSPRAKRYASRGFKRVPNAPASIEKLVCRCVSPKNGRVGKVRAAEGEYGGLGGKTFSAADLSIVPMSVVTCSAANADSARPRASRPARAALLPSGLVCIASFLSWLDQQTHLNRD